MGKAFNALQEHFKEIAPLGNLHIIELKEASEILAIFFSLDSKNFNVFWKSETLQNLCEKYCKAVSFKGIQQVQYTLILNLQKAFVTQPKEMQNLLKKVLENLEVLKQNQIAESPILPLIEKYFQALIEQKIQDSLSQKQEATQDSSALLQDFLGESLKQLQEKRKIFATILLQNFSHLKSHLETLDTLLQKTQTQHFSIGITGVLSSGKSTLLNALLGEEILGSSSIPETANLTLLKYAETPSAEVFFWNTQEWEDLTSTMEESSLSALLENQEFCEILREKVKDSTQSLAISLEELPKYTSANYPSKICNLIKETTLFTPLKFLKNRVEIVDTPGLDDPVLQREEITKNYLLKCDLLIHAMNAAQSATQIDVEFILEALQNANLCRVLILLTHADLLEEKELQSALSYTQKSIQDMLSKNFPSNEAELLFKRLDFIPLASYPALLCQTDPKKAEELGFSLEKSNFNALISYLNQTLLGNNSTKAKDLIYLCAQGFKRVFEDTQSVLTLEKNLLFAREEEIKNFLETSQEERRQSQEKLNNLKAYLNETKAQLQEYSKTLNNQLQQKLQEAQNLLSERIFEDIVYEYEKGKIPSNERLEYLLDLGLKDTLSDVLRFSTQSLRKKIAQLQGQFQEYLHEFPLQEQIDFSGFHFSLNPIILQKTKLKILNKILKSARRFNKNNTHSLKQALDSDFNEGFLEFITTLFQESKVLESQLISDFEKSLEAIKKDLDAHLESKENILQNALKNLSISKEEKEQKEKILSESENLLKVGIESFVFLQRQATGENNA